MDAIPDAIEIAAGLEEPFDVGSFLAFARGSGLQRGANLTEGEAAQAINQLHAMGLIEQANPRAPDGVKFKLTEVARTSADSGLLFPL